VFNHAVTHPQISADIFLALSIEFVQHAARRKGVATTIIYALSLTKLVIQLNIPLLLP
jgi:hypothetical protein